MLAQIQAYVESTLEGIDLKGWEICTKMNDVRFGSGIKWKTTKQIRRRDMVWAYHAPLYDHISPLVIS